MKRALLLSAGLGTRLKPITDSIPKCLVPINGKPLLEYWLDNLSEIGISEFIVNTHYLKEKVEEYCKNSKYKNMIKLVYEEKLLLTGGTILNCKKYLYDEPFMVVHADNLSFCDFSAFVRRHENRPEYCDITMMTFITDNPSQCGIVSINDYGVVENMFEKVENPPGNLANAAVYIMEPSVFIFLSTLNRKEIDLSIDVIPNFLDKIYTFHNNVYHRDIGTVSSYYEAQKCRYLRQDKNK